MQAVLFDWGVDQGGPFARIAYYDDSVTLPASPQLDPQTGFPQYPRPPQSLTVARPLPGIDDVGTLGMDLATASAIIAGRVYQRAVDQLKDAIVRAQQHAALVNALQPYIGQVNKV